MSTEQAQAISKIVIRHRYTYAVLFEYQPTEEQHSIGIAMRAALEAATNARSNLAGANLAGANLDGAYLAGVKLIGERPVFQIGPIGSRCSYFVAYLTDQGIKLRAGCFFGTVEEFREKLSKDHGRNDHATEYLAALALIDVHAAIWAKQEVSQ